MCMEHAFPVFQMRKNGTKELKTYHCTDKNCIENYEMSYFKQYSFVLISIIGLILTISLTVRIFYFTLLLQDDYQY